MFHKKGKKGSALLFLSCFLVIAFMPAASSLAGPPEIKAITFLPRAHKTAYPATMFAKTMEREAKGKLKFNYLGGPEVIPGKDQPEAVRAGAVDVFFGPANWAAGSFNFREIQVLMDSGYSPVEERKKGVHEYFVEACKKRGLYYLGRFDWKDEYYMWTTFPVVGPESLRGQKLYVPSSFIEVYKALKITGVTFPPQELYTAMERGTVDGTTIPLPGIRSFGIHELVKYCIDYPLHSSGLVGIMNLKKWESLSKDQQELFSTIYARWEAEELMPWYEKLYETERKALEAKGIKFVKFTKEGESKFMYAVEEEHWKSMGESLGKEKAEYLRKLVGK